MQITFPDQINIIFKVKVLKNVKVSSLVEIYQHAASIFRVEKRMPEQNAYL
jgi:hypothetical protein